VKSLLEGLVAPQLSAAIRAHRAHLNMTQEAFAEAVGTPQANISRWESGLVFPSMENLARLAVAMDRDADFVLEMLKEDVQGLIDAVKSEQ